MDASHKDAVDVRRTSVTPLSMEEARKLAEEWQQRLAGRIKGDSSDLLREDRESIPR
jgi:hypothetical protein